MLIELSYVLSETAPKWPTNPDEKYYAITSPEQGDINTTSSVYHHLHNGTHVDAPRHFDAKGATIEQLAIEDFYFTRACVLELSKKKGEQITLDDLKGKEAELADCDILLFYTGYSKLRDTAPEEFMNDFPYLSAELARYIRKELPKLKAIALDVLSVDSSVLGGQMGYPAHHALLDVNEENQERTLLIFEDVNVGKLLNVSGVKEICAFPVRWAGLEAGPVAMVAVV